MQEGVYMRGVPPAGAAYSSTSTLYCWAAALASWLTVAGRGNTTRDEVVARFGEYLNPDGSLPEGTDRDDPSQTTEGGIRVVFGKAGVELVNKSRADFTYDFVREKLGRPVGHLLLMEGVGGDMGHTYVVYGVGYPSRDYFSVYDPLTVGHRNRQFSEIGSSRIYVGWAK